MMTTCDVQAHCKQHRGDVPFPCNTHAAVDMGFVHAAGQQQHTSGYTADIESGKEKFLAAQHSPAERDYVAKYGQKAYRTASGVQVGVMPQPLTPGHTATVKIKALTEQEAAAPGRVVTS